MLDALPAPRAARPGVPLRFCGSRQEVAADVARLINRGWRFSSLPVELEPDVWLVHVRRPDGEPAPLRFTLACSVFDPVGWTAATA